MSFKVNWNSLETESLSEWTKELLTSALNSGKTPNILASDIEIKDLNFGKIAPNFEILEIGELDRDRFRGIFKINYDGDFHLTLHTQVQANPLNIYHSNSLDKEINGSNFVTPNFLLSSEQFALPLDLKLSDIRINGIGIIVFSKTKGLTLVFRNDPLDSIKVSSTFDTVQVLAKFLQNQIESQIRDLFRETLPTLIHQLSLNYLELDGGLHDLHSKLALNLDLVGTPPVPAVSDVTVKYYSYNLQKNLHLFNSRETLDLNIPKFRNVVQRSHLDKFNKNVPNLLNSLYLKMNEPELKGEYVLAQSNNGIPIDLLSDKNYLRTNQVLKEISSIQANSYYKDHNNKNDTTVKPKRRTFKMKKPKKQEAVAEQQPQTFPATVTPADSTLTSAFVSPSTSLRMSNSVSMNSDDLGSQSDTSTLIEEDKSIHEPNLAHPKPIRMSSAFYKEIVRPYHDAIHAATTTLMNTSPTPNPSNQSVISNVGLGNNCFNFTSTSPIKKHDRDIKSKNYLDINKINSKLHQLRMEHTPTPNEKVLRDLYGHHTPLYFGPPSPPPQYHV